VAAAVGVAVVLVPPRQAAAGPTDQDLAGCLQELARALAAREALERRVAQLEQIVLCSVSGAGAFALGGPAAGPVGVAPALSPRSRAAAGPPARGCQPRGRLRLRRVRGRSTSGRLFRGNPSGRRLWCRVLGGGRLGAAALGRGASPPGCVDGGGVCATSGRVASCGPTCKCSARCSGRDRRPYGTSQLRRPVRRPQRWQLRHQEAPEGAWQRIRSSELRRVRRLRRRLRWLWLDRRWMVSTNVTYTFYVCNTL
jgi:hypothetical protein